MDFAASSRVGDSFVGPDGASYEVSNVASATVISILPAYKGATVSGAAYAIMPVQGYDKMLSDAFNVLVNQFGAKLAALGTTGNYDVLPLDKGGTGATTQPAARAALGLGGAATLNVGTSPGTVLGYGSFGIGGRAPDIPGNAFNSAVDTGIYRSTGGTANSPANYGYGTLFVQNYDSGFTAQHATSFGGRQFFRINNNFSWGSWIEVYTTNNTTRSSDGTLKAI
ncbi:pyocin knob domain-containing protein [Pseudomonas extremorientalis]